MQLIPYRDGSPIPVLTDINVKLTTSDLDRRFATKPATSHNSTSAVQHNMMTIDRSIHMFHHSQRIRVVLYKSTFYSLTSQSADLFNFAPDGAALLDAGRVLV